MVQKIISALLITAGICLVILGYTRIVDGQRQVDQSFQSAQAAIQQKGKMDSSFVPEAGETIGLLHIPKLNAELPIVEGTAAEDLAKGVGHYHESYFPNEQGQIVLSGHRDTVFRRTGELVKGDQLVIELSYGRFTYEIEKTKIVKKDDQSIITLQQEKEELVLTTCYPFSFIGPAPNRYIIYGKRV
ncbi:class D sortase [Bacillus altitudinis]|uniref:class D sortase n=1 Tax=Bacillus altitudinis TaxID=293387 RepID=UPI001881F1D5|nr:class D sortase [Bacillus altitudinis]MDM5165538.1 class D sortase [Bacillus altitudinis]QOV50080.1 class D sortase [Bacillus altitudinis]WHY05874.1 class D sortase [Bacillus altitudinis]